MMEEFATFKDLFVPSICYSEGILHTYHSLSGHCVPSKNTVWVSS